MKVQKIITSPFDEKALKHFKNLLLDKRWIAQQEFHTIQNLIDDRGEADNEDYSSINHHMGNVRTDVEKEEINYELLERTKKYIDQIDDALDRIRQGSYGICQATGKLIPRERLNIVPHTRFSIEAKNKGLVEDV